MSFGLVFFWSKKRSFSKWALLYSLAAYAGAIVLKEIIQVATIDAVQSAHNTALLGIYYGTQTAIFEVGGAFLVASYAVSKGHFKKRDAESFGLGLAFWENGVLIGIPLLLNYVTYYLILTTPNSSLAETVYSALLKDSPNLFNGPYRALAIVGLSVLERISSLFAHFSWGFLAVVSAIYRRRDLITLVLPVGFLIDFLVPFASRMGTAEFELIIFTIGSVGLIVSLLIRRKERWDDRSNEGSSTTPTSRPDSIGEVDQPKSTTRN
ncbi:MAG: YhfC family intramembrane metalloprotease [Nitrososphaerota archaeon]|nr:YhfC family intramembrane metalloprotease [Nitrososphaerota archaeon]MDG6923898.1 YhfC family intramembrane metalloprotease [Nitrososphaerota archaeon]